jgi:hypothetical protein
MHASPARPLSPIDREALVVGMALVPGFVSRNRSFRLFEDPDVRRARRRAGVLRGIVRHLTGAHGIVKDVVVVHGAESFELRYTVPGIRVSRHASLTELELACVRYLAARACAPGMNATAEDRVAIEAALRRLSAGLRLSEIEARST